MDAIEQLQQKYNEIQTKSFEDWLECQNKNLHISSKVIEEVIPLNQMDLREFISELSKYVDFENLRYYTLYDEDAIVVYYTVLVQETLEEQQERFTLEYKQYSNSIIAEKIKILKQIDNLEVQALKERNSRLNG